MLIILCACGNSTEKEAKEKPKMKMPKKVEVAAVKASSPRGHIEYVGVLAAYRKADIACETGGTIEKLYFEKGDKIKKGQVIARISTSSILLGVRQAEMAVETARSQFEKVEKGSRPEEISMAEAVLREAQAALSEAEKNFNRIKGLKESGAASQSELDAVKSRVDMTRAKVDSAEQQLILARQGPRIEDRKAARASLQEAEVALALAKDRLRKSKLVSPINGIVVFRDIEEGEVIVVPPVKILTRIIDLSSIKIKISVGEKDIHILDKKKTFGFTIDAFPGETFSAQLFFRSPAADPATRSFPVELILKDPDPRMADGMTIRVRLPILDEKKTLKIPSAWLSEEDGKIGIYVAVDGRAQFREVTLGKYYDQRVEILKGLDEQDFIITNPAGIRSGDPIEHSG
ncbi:efflux RND transporter periplasmic adaptor subunit [Thermodesulfobacteriota bacterium]